MRTEKDIEEAQISAIKWLKKHIGPTTIIHTRTDYVRNSEADYIRAYICKPEPDGRYAILDITYYIATASDLIMTERGIRLGGGQYDKGLEIAETCWRVAFRSEIRFDQTNNWREIH